MQPVRMKERKRKEEMGGTSTSDGGLKVKRGSCTQKSPFLAGKSARGIRGPSVDHRETQQPVCGGQNQGRTVHTVCTAALYTPA